MKNKLQIAKLRKNFLKIPFKIEKIDISSDAYKLYSYFCGLPENCDPGIGAISKRLNVSYKTAYKAVNELLNKNMIRIIEQSGPNKRAIYELTNPENWKT